jgi:hypothetical protein
VGRAPFDERLHRLLRVVLRASRDATVARFVGDRGFERRLEAEPDRALAHAHRGRRQLADAIGECVRRAHQLLRRHEPVEQADPVRFLRVDAPAGEREIHGA